MDKKRYDDWLKNLKVGQEIRIQKFIKTNFSYEAEWIFIKGIIKSKNKVTNSESLEQHFLTFNSTSGILECPYDLFPVRIVPVSHKTINNGYLNSPFFEPLWDHSIFLLITPGAINISNLITQIRNELLCVVLDGILIKEGILVKVYSSPEKIISYIENKSIKQIKYLYSQKLLSLFS